MSENLAAWVADHHWNIGGLSLPNRHLTAEFTHLLASRFQYFRLPFEPSSDIAGIPDQVSASFKTTRESSFARALLRACGIWIIRSPLQPSFVA